MKRLYTLLSILLVSGTLMAQVQVTLMVDITKYLAAGTPLGANGIRVGGDFAATAAMNGATEMPAWSPSNVACALTNMGDSIWSITITYPSASIGMNQPFKFVNNDWGTNEGTDAANTIATDGCGTDDGAGNINRSLEIPAANITLQYCWDACLRCNGGSPDVTGIRDIKSFSALVVSPNPVTNIAKLSMNLQNAGELDIQIINLMGQEVIKNNHGRVSAGRHTFNIDLTEIPAGIYLARVISGGKVTSGNIVKL